MRKSERIRILELEVLRLSLELQFTQEILKAFMESNGTNIDMDAGKWYKKPGND